jgi:mRNA-degrading endonuclease RelE of RelBE toxin-antitoxin system
MVIRSAADDPGSASLAKLKGRPGECRIRTGAWRIIVELDNRAGTMTVLRVLPRKDAYR